MTSLSEERVVWNDTFYVETFDFRSRINFCRFDECTFARCTILVDDGTEQLAFTKCTFKNRNIDHVDSDDERGIVSSGNTFDRPLEEKRREFDERLATLLKARRDMKRTA
jgi:hypothetical protein